jgi:hypothetical protein
VHRPRALTTIVVASIVLGGGGGHAQTATPSDLTIGVIRSDGTLLPLASRRNGEWRELLRDDGRNVRLTSAAQQLRTGWTTVPTTGKAAEAVTVGRIVNTRYECATAQAFSIENYRGRRTRAGERIENVGLAAVGAGNIERPQDVAKLPDDASRTIAAFLGRTVDAIEADLIQRRNALTTNEPRRGPRTLRIDRLYRHRLNSVDEWTYFEVTKPYSSEADVYASGWINTSPSRLEVWRVHSGLGGTAEDLQGRPSDVLGIVRAGASNIWLLAQYSNVDEGYTLFDANDGQYGSELGRVLEVAVNHCLP